MFMKKLIALILSISLAACLASSTLAAPKKTAKKPAVKVIKITKKRTVKKPVKKPTLVKPAPAMPAAPAKPETIAPAPFVPEKVMNMGIGVKAGLVANGMGIGGEYYYSTEKILHGTMLKLGASYLAGTNCTGNDPYKAVTLNLGAVYMLDMINMGDIPLKWYVGGDLMYPVKVNGNRTGKWGIEAYIGEIYTVPDVGSVYAELGYAGLKYTDTQASVKGLNLQAGYLYKF